MNVRRPRTKRAHGAHVEAPGELGFTQPDERAGDAADELSGPPDRKLASYAERCWAATKLLAGVLVVVSASLGVAWGAHRYALRSPRFAITAVELHGAERLDEREVMRLAGIERGKNIFALDTQNAERRLLDNAWVAQVKVVRKLPQTIVVELTERDAAAVATIGDHLYLVARSGEPFKRLEPGDPFDLVTITGISAENLARDRAREVERISKGLEVLRQYDRVSLSKVHVAQELHLTDTGEAVLSVGKTGIALHLGHGPWRKKLLMAERVVTQMQQKAKPPGIVFLDNRAHPERVVVRMR
jgi:cell division protein FtsQ